ncbi:FAD-dependent monooxygenase [Streptomyces profundus]|uniref:FAD-dependent monooxygenase n=1 Tax=Streptomyces profundus TaxID=2867410 RepID=UPI001D161B1D|nr:FAD-dependent monooxygenase [Streptomyces sp. MA3_2.13]UED87504.1 FAD-dependent monooxygenase [Streptomyces sp. MA3_2.13]
MSGYRQRTSGEPQVNTSDQSRRPQPGTVRPRGRGDGPEIAIVGAGIGGLALARALRRRGLASTVYERTARFDRIGSGINVSPNATAALAGLGVLPTVRRHASLPGSWRNYDAGTGELRHEFPLGESAATAYGQPFLQMHRGDLHAALNAAVPAETVRLGKRLVGLADRGERVELRFQDGSTAAADLVVGADGIRSQVRAELFGPDAPAFTGRVAYRDVIPTEGLDVSGLDDFAKWWGEDRHIVLYFINGGREIYYVTSVPEDEWTDESWSAHGDPAELRAAFGDFPEPVRRVLGHGTRTYKWALCDRPPMESWGRGRVVLLGDACHPMTPYMAQGAAMALEDAVVLGRALADSPDDLDGALRDYQATRIPRTAWMQTESHKNTFMREAGPVAAVYGYDAWTAELTRATTG